MKNILTIISASAATALLVSGCSDGGATADGDTYSWDFTTTTSDTSIWTVAAKQFGESLNEKSDGRMELNVFANEQLSGGDPAAGVEQLANGDKAFSYNSPIIYSGIDGRFSAITAPFLFDSLESADGVLAGEGYEVYDELLDDMGIEFLGFGESGFRQLTTTGKEVHSPKDLENMKIRVPGSELFLDIFAEMGADPAAMDAGEIFTSLQNGTIDGQENPVDIIYTSGYDEVQDYVMMWGYVYDPLLLGMNKEMFEGLSEEDQDIVTEAAQETNEYQVQETRDSAEETVEKLKEEMEVVELTPKEIETFREAMAPVYKKHTEVWTEDIIERLQPKN